MAAYAAVVGLMNIMEQIGNHPRLCTSFNKNQVESLGENLDFLLAFIESFSSESSDHGGAKREVEDLERRIASAVHEAEDVIESHVVDQIHAGFAEKSPSFLIDLQKIIQDMRVIQEEVEKVAKVIQEEVAKKLRRKKIIQDKVLQPTYSTPAAPSVRTFNTMVGFDDVLLQLLDRLISESSGLQIIPIVGQGGIGKTTLARNAYEHPLIKMHFDICAWATVSLDFNVREILFQLVSFQGRIQADKDIDGIDSLGELLYRHLIGRRYLIILDDIQSSNVWDMMRIFFPDNRNGSRIIVTTRLSGLAALLSHRNALVINFLTEGQSWDLFCHTVFPGDGCLPELEELGKVIVRYCKGLPLSITVIGGLLRKAPMTQEYWEYVANNIGSILSSEDNQLRNVLMLSYDALPPHLKACFLYAGIFPKNHEFRVSRIIKLWVAEGILKPRGYQTLEDVGEDCMKELIDRNLILVSSTGLNGKPKLCRIHDLLRDLCIRQADIEKFLSVVREANNPDAINSDRRFAVHDSTTEKYEDPQFFHAMVSTLLARSIIHESPARLSFKSRLMRVLIEVYSDSLEATFQQVNLRFLAYESTGAPLGWIPTYELPSSISLLWNVQTLIVDKTIEEVVAPSEIWDMPQLRHLNFHRIRLPDPPASDNKDDSVLPNLQTLGTVLNLNCSEEVCKRMPNIKKLRISYDDFSGEGQRNSWYSIHNVRLFYKLESLYYCFRRVPSRDDLLQNLKFPSSLRKLILQDCELHWDDLSIIGWLPNLEVLKLKSQSVRGPKWNPVEGEFTALKILDIDSCYLIYWFADSCHFPCLKKLVLRRLYRLNEIPSGIGDIPSLLDISVVECSISAAISAVRILNDKEKRYRGIFHVRVGFRKEKEVAEFTARVEQEGLNTKNVQIDAV